MPFTVLRLCTNTNLSRTYIPTENKYAHAHTPISILGQRKGVLEQFDVGEDTAKAMQRANWAAPADAFVLPGPDTNFVDITTPSTDHRMRGSNSYRVPTYLSLSLYLFAILTNVIWKN